GFYGLKPPPTQCNQDGEITVSAVIVFRSDHIVRNLATCSKLRVFRIRRDRVVIINSVLHFSENIVVISVVELENQYGTHETTIDYRHFGPPPSTVCDLAPAGYHQ